MRSGCIIEDLTRPGFVFDSNGDGCFGGCEHGLVVVGHVEDLIRFYHGRVLCCDGAWRTETKVSRGVRGVVEELKRTLIRPRPTSTAGLVAKDPCVLVRGP